MLSDMVGQLTDVTYKKICEEWARTIILLSESQIHIWAPLSGGYSLMHHFAKDTAMQDQLFGNIKRSLAFVDGHESDSFSFENFEEQFFSSIGVERNGESVDEFVGNHTDQLIGLFIMGMDNALEKGNTQTLKQVGTLLEKHSHMSLVFITELPIPEMDIYHALIVKHMLVENIYYQRLFSVEDSVAFLKSLEERWQFTFKNGIERILAENIGGHILLLEEAARIVRNNAEISFKDVLANISLLRKAGAVFRALSPQDQEQFESILFDKPISRPVSEYLLQTGLIVEKKIGLQYFNYMHHNLLSIFNPFDTPSQPLLKLSYIEHRVLEEFERREDVISREDVAKTIWGEQALDKYSDWAIDQLIHRLREKLEAADMPYEIQTKKGEGFILLKK